MDSRELGLVAAYQLTRLEDFHYGFWEEGQQPSIETFVAAQKRYSDLIVGAIQETLGEKGRILDVGCGTGTMLARLVDLGYQVDGVIPSQELKRRVVEKIEGMENDYEAKIYDCLFENFPPAEQAHQYNLIYFSESFHYVPIKDCFRVVNALLQEKGYILICDLFKTPHHNDGGVGDKSVGGGHPIEQFYQLVKENQYEILQDTDITKNMSPNFDLLDDLFMNRLYPTIQMVDAYLKTKYQLLYRLSKSIFSRRLKKLKYKYFSGYRNRQTFEKYKTYHLMILKKN